MPKMKYFQAVGGIRDSYDTILECFDEIDDRFSQMKLKSRGLSSEDLPIIQEEVNVLRYIIACQRGLVYDGETNIQKPTIEAANRVFTRHLHRLDDVHGINATNANKFDNPIIKKQYKACRHYLFQFSLPGWVKNLPDEIESYDNKYSKN